MHDVLVNHAANDQVEGPPTASFWPSIEITSTNIKKQLSNG